MLRKLSKYFEGRKTIWCARLYTLAGIVVTAKELADAYQVDLSAYLPTWLGPTTSYWGLELILTGLLFEGLRWITRSPVPALRPSEDLRSGY